MSPKPGHPVATIDLGLRRLGQLFDSLDPSPFREKALDPVAHRYLVACAREQPGGVLRILVHAPRELQQDSAAITEAIRHHFRLETEQAARELRARMRAGRRALWRGLLVLALCSVLRGLLPAAPGLGWLGEGLLILGWVALWRPVEVLLYEHWEAADERRALERLAAARVEFVVVADTGSA
ncbi:MAG TPA: hypothetical protein PLN91_10990 [Rhodanobacteraceae bacterium]|nr:hypothetical protein [Rhodanobacteraceae bacterium]